VGELLNLLPFNIIENYYFNPTYPFGWVGFFNGENKMGTFSLDMSKSTAWLSRECDRFISWEDGYSERAEEVADDNIVRIYHSEYLIKQSLLLIEQEIVRHHIWDKKGHYHMFFGSLKEQKEYIENCQKLYSHYRPIIEKIIGNSFLFYYKNAKKENNDEILKFLKEHNWEDDQTLKVYLPFFYKDGRFREIKNEQYSYNKQETQYEY